MSSSSSKRALASDLGRVRGRVRVRVRARVGGRVEVRDRIRVRVRDRVGPGLVLGALRMGRDTGEIRGRYRGDIGEI